MHHHKRTRAQFEADLQAAQSPFAFYGAPLPARDDNVRDDGSYVPEWKQDVTDERGRKRLHGAFTGGFSAGYFNTVGSKEGWTPQTFVSSRANRAKDQDKTTQQRAEAYMDEEDLADAAEAQQLQTAGSFAGLGAAGDDAPRRNVLMDMVKTTGETMGVKLLQRMGWRQGQGVGPKVRRKARIDPDDDPAGGQVHLFAPDNSTIISFVEKSDYKGLGYAGEARLANTTSADRGANEDNEDDESDHPTLFSAPKKQKPTKKSAKKSAGGFGVGILNDNGSDEEDPYEMGPRISYNRVIGGDKKTKKKEAAKTTANPLLSAKPVFISKKSSVRKADGFRKCHDGRLPLDGFILATQALTLSSNKTYAPPTLPPGWQSGKKASTTPSATEPPQSTADAAKASTHTHSSRAALLGEAPLPGKSVFDFVTPAARARIAASSGKTNLPAAGSEAPPPAYKKTAEERDKELWDLVPALEKDTAELALKRGTGGWMPYADDEGKRARYRSFLELRAGVRNTIPARAPAASTHDWQTELAEFAAAARVFRPVTGLMASRFTSSSASSAAPPGNDTSTNNGTADLLHKPPPKPSDPAEEAARIGMYGPMTRSERPFHPPRLVCKRFNVPLPVHGDAQGDGAGGFGTAAAAAAAAGPTTSSCTTGGMQDAVSRSALDEMLRAVAPGSGSGRTSGFVSAGVEGGTPAAEAGPLGSSGGANAGPAVVDVERNEAVDGEMAGEALLRAVFGSDDEGDE